MSILSLVMTWGFIIEDVKIKQSTVLENAAMNQNSADIDFMEEVRNEPTVGEAIFKEIPADATHLQEEREGVVSQGQQEIQEEAEVQIPTELEVVYGLMGIDYPLESEYDTEEDSVSILEEEADGKFSRQQKYISNKGKLGLEFNCPDKVTPECGKSANKRDNSPAVGTAGGLEVLWDPRKVSIENITNRPHWQGCWVKSTLTLLRFFLINVYGPISNISKRVVWAEIGTYLGQNSDSAFILGGDFNAILDLSKERGGIQ
ncbi:hypothetical protein SUGI_0537450 [Cryptomeria japonica]|nr:hypothetical protein SUGI_0537450 [Cryptomeria japonica]